MVQTSSSNYWIRGSVLDKAKVASVLSEHLSMDFFITANADEQTRTKAHEIFLENKIIQLKQVLKT